MKLTRIPLDVVVTATGEQTPDVLVAVMASELDALELVASRLAGTRNTRITARRDSNRHGVALAAYDDKVPDYGDPREEADGG